MQTIYRPMENQYDNIGVVIFGFVAGLLKFLSTGGYWSSIAEAAFTALVCAVFASAGKELFKVCKNWYINRKNKTK
jgi:hypothetical protein